MAIFSAGGLALGTTITIDETEYPVGHRIFLPFNAFKIIAGSWVMTVNAADFYHIWNNAAASAVNDEIEAYINLTAGTWKFVTVGRNGTNAGQVTLYIDDNSKGVIDNYAAGAGYAETEEITGITIATGAGANYKITLKVTGKHASSSDYHFHTSFCYFERTA